MHTFWKNSLHTFINFSLKEKNNSTFFFLDQSVYLKLKVNHNTQYLIYNNALINKISIEIGIETFFLMICYHILNSFEGLWIEQ